MALSLNKKVHYHLDGRFISGPPENLIDGAIGTQKTNVHVKKRRTGHRLNKHKSVEG